MVFLVETASVKSRLPGRNGLLSQNGPRLVQTVCLVKNSLLSQNGPVETVSLVEMVFSVKTASCESKRPGQDGLHSQRRSS